MTTYKFENLQITGKVSVTAESHISWDCLLKTVAVMGPTGAGKSAFIEALCGDASLGISKNQLEGCTQDVSAYRLINVLHGNRVYLIDTPGFADRKISDMEIVSKLHEWLQQYGALQTFKEMTGIAGTKDVTIVTTMWDTLNTEEGLRQAESRFQELKNGPWMDSTKGGAKIEKFLNTQDSALYILDRAMVGFNRGIYTFQKKRTITARTPFFPNLLSDLKSRVGQLRSQEKTLATELEETGPNGDAVLVEVLQQQLEEVRDDLARFQPQLDHLQSLEEKPSNQYRTSFRAYR